VEKQEEGEERDVAESESGAETDTSAWWGHKEEVGTGWRW
jgi:hypothetical protein